MFEIYGLSEKFTAGYLQLQNFYIVLNHKLTEWFVSF